MKGTKSKQTMPRKYLLNKPSHSAPERLMPLYADDNELWDVDNSSVLNT
jgi:hypothetical protein